MSECGGCHNEKKPVETCKSPQACSLRTVFCIDSGGVGLCICILNDIHVSHDTFYAVSHHSISVVIDGALRGGRGASGCNRLAGVVGAQANKEGEKGRGQGADDVGAAGTVNEGTSGKDHAGNNEAIGKLVPEGVGLNNVIDVAREDLEAVLPHTCSANRETDHHSHGDDSGEHVEVKVVGHGVVGGNGAQGIETQETTDDASRGENHTINVVGRNLTVVDVVHIHTLSVLAIGLSRPLGPRASPSRPMDSSTHALVICRKNSEKGYFCLNSADSALKH